jgi:hypothetical protein
MTATLTVMRGQDYLTVALSHIASKWVVTAALDEYGNTVTLTEQEWSEAIRRASKGEDETGR